MNLQEQKAQYSNKTVVQIEMKCSSTNYPHLYHGTDTESGFSILKNGIWIPKNSRWEKNGKLIPLEHGFRFYTSVDLEASRQFSKGGMILRFVAPFPMGITGVIDPGPGGGGIQISFGKEAINDLYRSLSDYSLNSGKTWIPKSIYQNNINHNKAVVWNSEIAPLTQNPTL